MACPCPSSATASAKVVGAGREGGHGRDGARSESPREDDSVEAVLHPQVHSLRTKARPVKGKAGGGRLQRHRGRERSPGRDEQAGGIQGEDAVEGTIQTFAGGADRREGRVACHLRPPMDDAALAEAVGPQRGGVGGLHAGDRRPGEGREQGRDQGVVRGRGQFRRPALEHALVAGQVEPATIVHGGDDGAPHPLGDGFAGDLADQDRLALGSLADLGRVAGRQPQGQGADSRLVPVGPGTGACHLGRGIEVLMPDIEVKARGQLHRLPCRLAGTEQCDADRPAGKGAEPGEVVGAGWLCRGPGLGWSGQEQSVPFGAFAAGVRRSAPDSPAAGTRARLRESPAIWPETAIPRPPRPGNGRAAASWSGSSGNS